MTLPRIIGIAGRKGAGKDTAAAALQGYENIKFAGALKEMMRAFYRYVGVAGPTIDRMIDGDLKEVPVEHLGGKTTRWAMQTLGTEWGRVLICDDIWIRAFLSRAKQFVRVVNTDMRFLNEVDAVKALGGTTVRVMDPNFVKPEQEHASEAMIDDLPVDAVVVNNKAAMSISDLHESFWMTLAHIEGAPA